MSWKRLYRRLRFEVMPEVASPGKSPQDVGFLCAIDPPSRRFFTLPMIREERLALNDLVRRLRHIDGLGVLGIDIPIAMTYRPGNADIGQPQNFVFLRTVIRFAVASLAKPAMRYTWFL